MPLGTNDASNLVVIPQKDYSPDRPKPVITRDAASNLDMYTGRIRGNDFQNTGLFDGSAIVPLWVPQGTGYRGRLRGIFAQITGDAAISGGGQEIVLTILEGVTKTGLIIACYIPASPVAGMGQQLIGPFALGDGYVSKVGGITFNVSSNYTLTTGKMIVTAWGNDEGPN